MLKILNELHMTAWYTKNTEQWEVTKSVMAKLCSLIDSKYINIVYDIQRNYRLSGSGDWDKITEARQKSRVEKLNGAWHHGLETFCYGSKQQTVQHL